MCLQRKLARLAASTAAIGLAGLALAQTPVPPSEPWAQTRSDLPADPALRFGTLANGMRYAIRRNTTPPGQVACVDTALDVLREQVSVATMAPAAIDGERGVIIASTIACAGARRGSAQLSTDVLARKLLAKRS